MSPACAAHPPDHPRPTDGFGARISAALERRGVRKLYPLALELGVDESALSRWRRGCSISLEHAVSLALHLDISLDWLLAGRGGMEGHKPPADPPTGLDPQIAQALRQLPPPSLALLAAFVQSLAEGRAG